MADGRYFWDPFLTAAEKGRIVAAITAQERRTTGEIRVHIMARTGARDLMEFAEHKFMELGLDKTDHRNGVLILISRWEQQFAIWGDEALHEKSGPLLWTRSREAIERHFAERRYLEGIEACIVEVGNELARHFPKANGRGRDQLSNEVSEDARDPL